MVSILGLENAQKLVDAFGGESQIISRCSLARKAQRNAEILRMHTAGRQSRDIAHDFHLSVGWVNKIIAHRNIGKTAENSHFSVSDHDP